MNTSVFVKLNKARLALAHAPLKKSGHNKFAGYHYFELGDFLPTVLAVFSELGLCGIVSYTADTASLSIVDTESGEQVTINSPMGSAALKGCHEVQNIGAVETYQRRYLWVTAMEIVENDVLDSQPLEAKPKAERGNPTDGAWDAMDKDQKIALEKLAIEVRTFFEASDIPGAWSHLIKQGLDSDEKVALWTLLESKIRSALKKEQERLEKAKEPTQ